MEERRGNGREGGGMKEEVEEWKRNGRERSGLEWKRGEWYERKGNVV